MTPNEGQQLAIESRDRELPDNHWNRVYTDPDYFGEFAKRPAIQTGASLSPFPETYAKRQANIAYLSSSLEIPAEEMPAIYEAKKNEIGKTALQTPTLSDEGLFNYFKKQFDRENEVNTAADGIYQEVQKSVFQGLFDSQAGRDITDQPTYRPVLEQKLNEAGELLSDEDRLRIRENADKMADNLRRAKESIGDEARWLFDIVSKQTGRGQEYELAGEQPNPAGTVGGLGPVMNLAVKQPEAAPAGEVDLNDPEMLNFQTEQILEKFADMPTERRQSIYLLAGAFAELNQVNKGVFYQAAETLGRFLTREMGERISRNFTEESIRGQQRLLQSDLPLYEATNLDGSKGLSQAPTSGQAPITAEQREKLKADAARKLKILQIKRELVNLADTQIDPIKVVTDWPTWEQGFYGFVGSIPYAGIAAIPFVGFPAITASFFGQYKDDLLLEYPDMDPDQAAAISALAAPMAAGLELIQANLVMGRFVSLDRAIKFFLKPSRNPMTRIIARGTASFGMETGIELSQNRVLPILQTLGAALSDDIPDYDWRKDLEAFDEELGVTAVTMLLFTLTGLPFITSQEIGRNAAYLQDKKMLKYFGMSEEQADRVSTSLTKKERVAAFKEAEAARDPALIEAGRRQLFVDTMAQLQEPADPFQPSIRRDGDRFTVLDAEGNTIADRVDVDTAFYEFERIAGSSETLFASVQGELINALLEAGQATNPEGFSEQIDVATQEVINRYNNMTPEQLQRRIAQWERETGQTWQPGAAVNITAVNTLENVKEGLFQSITRVVKAKSPEEIRAVLEDRAEGQYKMALQAGQFTESDMVGWIREYESGTGDSLLEKDFTSRDVVEAVSTMSVAYYSGNLDNARVSSRLRAFFEALKEYFAAIFARGIRIKEAIAAGQIAPEFEAFLAQSVGLDIDRQIGVQAAQQARAEINAGGLVESTFSIAAAVGGDGFYSQLENALLDKIQGKSATPQQVKAIIENPQNRIKAEEVKWSGVMQAIDRIAAENNNKVSKDALINYLENERRIDFETVTYGDREWPSQSGIVEQLANGKWQVRYPGLQNRLFQTEDSANTELERLQSLFAEKRDDTRYGQYTLEGGDNYREVVLTMLDESGVLQRRKDFLVNEMTAIMLSRDSKELNGQFTSEVKDRLSDLRMQVREIDERLEWQGTKGSSLVTQPAYTSRHFRDAGNYVAHMRLNERQDTNGDSGLFIEEMQSDRHQAGRKQGYKGEADTNPPPGYILRELRDGSYRYVNDAHGGMSEVFKTRERAVAMAWKEYTYASSERLPVPDAPFRKEWPLALFKRALRDAVEKQLTWIGWTTGATQNERYDLSQQVEGVRISKFNVPTSAENIVDVLIKPKNKEVGDPEWITAKEGVNVSELPGIIGKELADKFSRDGMEDGKSWRTYSGVDLELGGAGMKGFYDVMLPKEIGKYVKQWGGVVEKSAVEIDGEYNEDGEFIEGEWGSHKVPIWKVDLTPEMVASVQAGQPTFSISQAHDALKANGKARSDIDLKSLPRFADDTKSHLVDEKLAALDAIYREVGDPLESEESWFSYVRAIGRDADGAIIMPPARAMEYAKGKNITRITDDLLKHPEFVEARESGLAIGTDMLAKFRSGELGRRDLASLFIWGLLSRGVGAYPQEGGFLALHNNGLLENLDKVFAGEMTMADLDAWSRGSMKGSPGASSTQNAMKVADQMSAMMTEIDGRMAIDVLLDAWKSGMTGPQLRREVRRIFTNDRPSIQIQNKVLSFIILVSGRPDVLVLDRVQFRHMWGGERLQSALSEFHKDIVKAKAATIKKYGKNSPEAALASAVSENPTNIYDALPVIGEDGTFKFAVKKGDKAIATNGIAKIGDGMHGMALYEALERAVDKPVAKAYKKAGISYPGVGAFHWDSWLVESQQAISHPTLAVIARTDMRPSLGVTEGKFNKLSYGMVYRYDGNYMRELLTRPGVYAILNRDQIKRFNTKEVFKAIGREIPLESNEDGSKRVRPWINDLTEQERERFDGYLTEIAERTASIGDAGDDGGTDGGGRGGSGEQSSVGTFAISPASYYGDLESAVAALNSNPAFRRERVAAVLNKFKRIKEQFANKADLEPLSMPEAVAQLEAIITLLPPDAQSEVGGFRRLLSFATAKGRLNYLTDRIAKADAALEKYLRTELQEDIMDLLERAMPRPGENKVQTSSLGPDAQRVANLAIAAIELGTDETSNTMAEIEAALASPDIDADRQEQLLEQWGVLNALGDFFNRSALELDQARVFLRQTFGAGRAMWRMQQEARRKQYRDMAEELAGGLKKATENQIDKMDKENPWLKNPRQFVLSHYSFMQLLRSVLPKAGFLETWERSIRQAEIGSSRYRMDAAKRFIDTLMAASGKKTSFGVGRLMYNMRKTRKAAVRYKEGYNEKLIRLPMETAANILEGRASAKAFKLNAEAVAKMSEAYLAVPLMRRRTTPSGAVRETPNRQQFLEFYVLKSEGTDDKLNMSPAEAMQLLLAWDQSEVQARMRRQGWTDESIEDMQKMVTSVPGGDATMDFLRREYKAGGDAADPVYMKMFGMAMPRIENYAPTRYRHKDDSNDLSPMGSALELAGTTPGSLKARQRHDARMRRTDAITVFFQHAAQMGHWIHFAEINREIRGVLKNQNVRESMEATMGRSGLQIFDQWMDTLAQGGGRRAMELSADKDIWAALISAKSIASLGFSVRTLFMQIDAASRAALDMGLAEYTKTVLDPRWMADMPKAWNSDTVQRRLIEGSRPEVRYVFERAAVRPSMLLWAAQKSMIPMQMTDAALTSFTAAIVYRNAYNKAKKAEASDAMAEQAALDAMDKAVFNYSQPIDITSRSLREVQGNMLQKVYMMFLSDARLKTALFAEAIGQLGKEGERGKGASTISALMIMAVVTQTMANLYRDWFSDEPDDEIWTLEGYAMAMMLAPLSGYMLVGTVGSTVVREAFGEMTFQSTDPANEMIDRGIRSIKGWDNTFNTSDPEAMLKQWNNLLRFASFNPTLAAPAALLNFAKPIVGAMENAENPE